MIPRHVPSIAVHVIWHPSSSVGKSLARALFSHLFENADDLSSHGVRIPVWQWRTRDDSLGEVPPPDRIELDRARTAVVVPILDRQFAEDPPWDAFLARTVAGLGEDDHVIPVLVEGRLRSPLDTPHAIRLHGPEDPLAVHKVRNQLTARLCTIVEPQDDCVPVFISHASEDANLAEEIGAYLDKGGSVKKFLAPTGVRPGDTAQRKIEEAAASQLMLAIRTDAYVGREWCQREVLKAKLARKPVVVLDALRDREARGFPYLGNGPVLRWREELGDAHKEDLLGLILREALRFRYFKQRVQHICDVHERSCPEVWPLPPELITMLAARGDDDEGPRLLVYPDPPLATDELAVIQRLDEDVDPITPLMLLSS